jgi:hypothetical protein
VARAEGGASTAADIAKREGLHRVTVDEALRLALIAPKLVQATLDGTLQRTVTLESLLRAALPMDGQDQQQLFGASR